MYAQSEALIPQLISKTERQTLANFISIVAGIALISLLAQVIIPLPWTPVPITGQTFGVTLVALSWGRKRALAVILSYLALGGLGLPIFAAAKSGLLMGPTLGYLVGMIFSSMVVGYLADKGFTRSFGRSLVAAFSGSLLVFTFGVIGLSFFLPAEMLLTAGVLPFIPGDIIKNTLAAYLSAKVKTQKYF